MPQAGPPPEDLKEKPRPQPKPAAKPAAKPAPKRRNLEAELGQMLVMANLMAAPFLGPDAMDDAEILVLARAMNDQANKSPRFRKIVEGALTASGSGGLLGVVVIIGGRRLARHRVIEPIWDQRLEAMLRLQLMDLDPTDPAAMEAAAAALAASMMEQSANGQTGPESGNGTAPGATQ